ncbi:MULTISPECIES: LysR family transcriptional regulator [Paenibacillus]|uniref:LysR family transcriptional regulator n=1 Tax=Paenibacillus TaxID=44249 RepID=UPI00088B8D75|nr:MULTISPECIES: LysR family transcriptional regulator [Paenibacillus]TDL70515.1 LysR family transcriptional regulator [Paenibacillus amylolyticus]SDC26991.1 DNA-binding transcriptional regulator, LysR family [Paenibacillus sp. CF095]
MDIKQCRYFIAIAEEKQITAAARRLHMAQPPLSQQLKLMEEELGVILFERKGRMMELTQAGRSFYDYAVTLTKYMEEAVMEMQSFRHGIRGKLSIGINTISDRLIPQALQQFRTTHPQVTYKIQQNESAQLCRLLEDGKVELACVRMPVQTERYEVLHLPQEPLFYISSTPLDSPTEMTPGAEMRTYFNQLTGIPLLLPSTEGLGMFELILDKFREHQVTPSIMGECSDINMLLELVRLGFASSIVPHTVLQLYHEHPFHVYRIQDQHSTVGSALVWLQNRYLSKPAQHFVQLVQGMLPVV